MSYSKIPITKDVFWSLFERNEHRLKVFSTITDPEGCWLHPSHGVLMTEWGFTDQDIPFIGILEKWPVDEFGHPDHASGQVQYWRCMPSTGG